MMKQLVMSVVVAFAFGVRGAEKNDWENPEVNSINRLPPRTVRLGCPSDGTIRNGVFRNLKMRGRNGVLSGHPVRYLQDGDSGSCRMENLLVENCDIDVKASPSVNETDGWERVR